jgi:hypothetical protein
MLRFEIIMKEYELVENVGISVRVKGYENLSKPNFYFY